MFLLIRFRLLVKELILILVVVVVVKLTIIGTGSRLAIVVSFVRWGRWWIAAEMIAYAASTFLGRFDLCFRRYLCHGSRFCSRLLERRRCWMASLWAWMLWSFRLLLLFLSLFALAAFRACRRHLIRIRSSRWRRFRWRRCRVIWLIRCLLK